MSPCTRIVKFLRVFKPVEIKVVQRDAVSEVVIGHKLKRGAFHAPGKTGSAQKRAGKRGLSGAEVSLKAQVNTGFPQCGCVCLKRRAGGGCEVRRGRFIG